MKRLHRLDPKLENKRALQITFTPSPVQITFTPSPDSAPYQIHSLARFTSPQIHPPANIVFKELPFVISSMVSHICIATPSLRPKHCGFTPRPSPLPLPSAPTASYGGACVARPGIEIGVFHEKLCVCACICVFAYICIYICTCIHMEVWTLQHTATHYKYEGLILATLKTHCNTLQHTAT